MKTAAYDPAEMQLMIDAVESSATDDRTIAIVCLAHIEDALAELLRANLAGFRPDLERALFSPGGPLSTFGNKLKIAEAMQVIYPNFARELSRMATIRNRFAHKLSVTTFDSELVRDYVDELTSLRDVALLSSAALVIPPTEAISPSRRRRFSYSAVVAALALNGEELVMMERVRWLERLSS